MNSTNRCPKRRRNTGGAMIPALTFASITLLIAGVMSLLTLSYITKARSEASYQGAYYLAERGVKHEIKHINAQSNPATTVHQWHPVNGQPGPILVDLGPAGQFRTGVLSTGDGNWTPGTPAVIRSEGTFRGVTRVVETLAAPESLFGNSMGTANYALFAQTQLTLSGGATRCFGDVGLNTTNVTFSGGSFATGKVVFYGVNPTMSGSNVYKEATSRVLPTVDQVVAQKFGSWANLKANNNNDRLKQFKPGSSAFLLSQAVSAGFTKGSWLLTDIKTLTKDNHPADQPKKDGGTRYCSQNTGLYGKPVVIFPPGDYYFDLIDLSASSAGVLIDNQDGPVNIYTNGSSVDKITAPVIMTSNDPNMFKLWLNKPKTFALSGSVEYFPGVIYAIDPSGQGGLTLSGGSHLFGAFYAWKITVSGGSIVEYPGSPMGMIGDPGSKFQATRNWKEKGRGLGSVYADGTNY